MGILTKWKKGGRGEKFASKVFVSSRKMERPNRRETLAPQRPTRILEGVLWGAFFLVAIYALLFSPFLITKKIEVTGASEVSADEVKMVVAEKLSGKYLGLWPKGNLFAVRPHAIESMLSSDYPLFRSVSVTREFPDTLRVAVAERQHIIIWRSGDASMMVDEEGRLIRNDAAFLGENASYVLTVSDMGGQPISEGQQVADGSFVAFVGALSDAARDRIGLDIGQSYTTTSRFANELRMTTSEGWDLYVNTSLPIETTIGTLSLLFGQELPLEKRSELRSIDLRVENRIYYAFREGQPATQQPAAAPVTEEKKEKKK